MDTLSNIKEEEEDEQRQNEEMKREDGVKDEEVNGIWREQGKETDEQREREETDPALQTDTQLKTEIKSDYEEEGEGLPGLVTSCQLKMPKVLIHRLDVTEMSVPVTSPPCPVVSNGYHVMGTNLPSAAISTSNKNTGQTAELSSQVFACSQCPFVHTEEVKLHQHIEKVHPEEDSRILTSGGHGGENPLPLNSTHQHPKTLPTPTESHTGTPRAHTCSQCGKSFKYASHLTSHQRTHTGEHLHQCSQCGKPSKYASSLKTCQQSQTGKRPHQCSQCRKGLSTSTSCQDSGPELPPHSIKSLLQNPFQKRTLAEKLHVKELGPDRPDIVIRQPSSQNGKPYTRGFTRPWYTKKAWLAGCSDANALFCFPCLLFKTTGTESKWTTTGVRDMKHLSEKVKKHENTRAHMENSVKLALFGNVNTITRLDEGYAIGVRKHNKEVDMNRYILSKISDCVKFCGAFELALHGCDETDASENPGVFRGLVDVVASLDSVLEEHLKTATAFKGTSKTVQNELLDCMLSVLKEYILEEVKSADFIAIQADETTDILIEGQLVLVLRYIDVHNNVQERLFELIPIQNAATDTITTALLERLKTILPNGHKDKFIAQAYDGAKMMRGTTGGMQRKIQDIYENAHYVHCYAHQPDIIIQQATSHIPGVRIFFSDLGGFSTFFSRSSKRIAMLEKMFSHRLHKTSTTRLNFHSQAVNTVHEHKNVLVQYFETIRDSADFDPTTVREAGGFVRLLEDEDFCFFLELFHSIMPHVDMLFNQLQKRNIDSVYIKGVIQKFTNSMVKIRGSIPSLCGEHIESQHQHPVMKRRRTLGQGERQKLAAEVCDAILTLAKERLSFTQHLISDTLLQGELFPQHSVNFPDAVLEATVEAYPMLNKAKLKAELSLIYENNEFKACSSALGLYRFLMENNLQGTFTETVSLLSILITTPMTTTESERCVSTLKRIKTFLRNTMTHGHLNALAMLSIEKKLVRDIPDFNKRVIEKFAIQKQRRAKFLYK